MKATRTASQFFVELSWAEWDHLRAFEDACEGFLPDSWKFSQRDKIDSFEWNGHFGTNFFFRAEPGAENQMVQFLRRYLKPTAIYTNGLEQGKNGADLACPEGISELDQALLLAGYERGQRVGKQRALTQGSDLSRERSTA
jgi:hypothetical protein